MKTAFTSVQPKHGDRVLHCAHIMEGAESGHFYALGAEPGQEPEGVDCSRPDGSKIKPKWIVICDACQKEHGRNPAAAVTGDAEWQGNEPAIKTSVH